ncbi:MAG TPA: 5'/3'-nucleotidase SurE [Candidatus Dormibacteraeota bacterium]|nr:5'/3'-nucleotidase SurE [Candidatus Dormibacteraeota bacterium]
MTDTPRPSILVTNDDGVASPGIHALFEAMRQLGDVTMVAPEVQRSAVGHAITRDAPLRTKRVELGYAVSGTPADCVQLAVRVLLARTPDLVVSGINLGPNTATNIIYSGTVSAATEARMMGIPAMSISIGAFENPLWETAAAYAKRFAKLLLQDRIALPPKVVLNVNVPNLPLADVKGIKVTRQGDSGYKEIFQPRGDSEFWAQGTYAMTDVDADTDALALDQGFVSLTPVTFDLTAYELLDPLRMLETE